MAYLGEVLSSKRFTVIYTWLSVDLLTDMAVILNLLNLRSIMGCPGVHSLSIYAQFSGKKRTSLYISWEKGHHHYIETRHKDLFSPFQSFSRKT